MGRTLALLVLVAGAVAGCTSMGPDFVAPHEKVPDAYSAIDAARRPDQPATRSDTAPDEFWWREFHDPVLEKMEDAAVAGNLDLKVDYLRVVESRLQVDLSRAQGLPSLNASAKVTHEQLGLAGIIKSQGLGGATESANTQSLISALEKPINLFQLGFDASWELDLFGKVRRNVEAADAQSEETREMRNDFLVTLRAEVAENYLELRAGQVLEHITQDLIADQRQTVELTENSQRHGLTGQQDVDSANAQLANLESQLPQYHQNVERARHALAVLTGRPPEALDLDIGDATELPALPSQVDIGIPSTLARRRPDIRNAEAALHAATAQVGVSVASLYPDISLAGTAGLRNVSTGYLFNWASKYYSAGPTVSVPIFSGGSLRTNIELSRTEAAAAAFAYRRTVLSALQDVEDGLVNLHDDAERTAALRKAVDADARALKLDSNAYQRGLVTYISVLTVQREASQARQQLAQAMLTQCTDLVKLYKSLGGGWESADTTDSTAGR